MHFRGVPLHEKVSRDIFYHPKVKDISNKALTTFLWKQRNWIGIQKFRQIVSITRATIEFIHVNILNKFHSITEVFQRITKHTGLQEPALSKSPIVLCSRAQIYVCVCVNMPESHSFDKLKKKSVFNDKHRAIINVQSVVSIMFQLRRRQTSNLFEQIYVCPFV